jgi:hypothetical protein
MRPDPDDRQFIWLQSSMLRLYDLVESDAKVTGVAISVHTGDGSKLLYTAEEHRHEIQRTLVTPEAHSFALDFAAAAVDLTPETAP